MPLSSCIGRSPKALLFSRGQRSFSAKAFVAGSAIVKARAAAPQARAKRTKAREMRCSLKEIFGGVYHPHSGSANGAEAYPHDSSLLTKSAPADSM